MGESRGRVVGRVVGESRGGESWEYLAFAVKAEVRGTTITLCKRDREKRGRKRRETERRCKGE